MASCGVAQKTVVKVQKRARELNLSWPLDDSMTDGKGFFFIQSEQYVSNTACIVVDVRGTLIVQESKGFDDRTMEQIPAYIHLPEQT